MRKLILLLALASTHLFAATWYVSTSGSDSNSGTSTGSPYLTVGKAVSSAASGDQIDIKAGTYTLTSTIAIGSSLANLTFQGYQTTPGDEGTKPLITTATNSTTLMTTASNGGTQIWDNISFSNTASVRASGILQIGQDGNSQWWVITNCLFNGFTTAVNSDNAGADYYLANIAIVGTEIKNSTSYGVNIQSDVASVLHIEGSYFHANASHVAANGNLVASRSIFAGSSGNATNIAGSVILINDTFAGNTGNALYGSTGEPLIMYNNIFYANGTGVYFSGTTNPQTASAAAGRTNAFGSNSNIYWNGSPGDITLTADPFVNDSVGNYALNSTAGGGALLKGAGFSSSFGGTSTGSLDIGAVQSVCSGGGSAFACGFSLNRPPAWMH